MVKGRKHSDFPEYPFTGGQVLKDIWHFLEGYPFLVTGIHNGPEIKTKIKEQSKT